MGLIDASKCPCNMCEVKHRCGGPVNCAEFRHWSVATVNPIHYAGGCYCRECSRCDGFPGPDILPGEVGICKPTGMTVKSDDFCSYGRRREDANG